MRSQGNIKADILQPYNLQSSYQNKGVNIGQKNSKSSQNRSSHIYPSMMSPQSSTGYGSINQANQLKTAQTEQYVSQGSNAQILSTGKNLSLTSAIPIQYNKLNSEGQTSSHIQSQLGGGGISYSSNKPSYGYGNYNTIDHTSSNITDSNYLYNGHRQQNKKLNTAIGNQSASSIIGYNGLINSQGNGLSQSLQQQQQVNKPGNYVMTENNQLLLPKLQNQTEGPIIITRQMNNSLSEKVNLRSQTLEADNIQSSSQKKQDINSKNNLRNIVKYYNNTPSAQSNPYGNTFQQQISTPAQAENQSQQQLVNLNNQGRISNVTSAAGSSNNLNQNNGTDNRGNQNSQNSTQNYYNITSARPPSNNNPNKNISQTNQYNQYSGLGSPTNTSQQQKLQQSQQSVLSPNSKSSRLQTSNEGSQKTPLKVIQPTQATVYMSNYQTNQPQARASLQNTITNNDLLDIRMLPKIDKSKISTKQIGNVFAYGANTHQGLVRGYNEDRVSIILNMVKPPEKSGVADWPNISFFAIYDGHGGAQCADFLRDQLHFYIIKDEEFPKNPQKAIHNGFIKCEDAFLKQADSQNPLDKSGSCAIVVMLINEMIYVANLGDSRAVLSSNNGQKVLGLTVDHKPNHPDEEKRIIMNGGKIYQSQIPTLQPKQYPQFIKGPHRVLPGRLAVSRTFGDAEAKLKKYGGNAKVISCEPEITNFGLSSEHDFIMLGCDGIFDKLTNNQSIDFIWDSMRETFKKKEMRQSIHDYIGDGIENLIKQTLIHKSFDNLTVVMICFKNLEKLLLA